jgi:hypothetical protein
MRLRRATRVHYAASRLAQLSCLSRLSRLYIAGLLIALAAAQTLGLVHRIVHSPHAQQGYMQQGDSAHEEYSHEKAHRDANSHGSAHQHAHPQAHQKIHEHAPEHADDYRHQGSWIAQLFAHQDSGDTCRLMDAQASSDMTFALVAQVLPAQPAIITIAFSQILSTARAAALFDARGPPAVL